jgi:GNAT superfamily N-acetyltransferase
MPPSAFPGRGDRIVRPAGVSDAAEISTVISDRRFHLVVATLEVTIVGVVTVKNRSRIYRYFVGRAHAGLGVGRSLWNVARDHCHELVQFRGADILEVRTCADRSGTGERRKQRMGFTTFPGADSQDRDQPAVMVFLVDTVTGETAEHSTVRTAFFTKNRSPEDFYPAEAIVKYGTVD